MPGFRRRFPYWRKVPKVVEQPRNGLGVVQLAPVNHLFQFAGFIESGNNFLIVFGRSLARNAVRSQQQKHALLEKSGCREHIEEDSQFLGPVPRFFRQFPRCRRLWILAGLHSTRDQLQQELLGRMPVLLDHHDAPVWKDWQYHNRPGMRNHLALRPQTCRFDQLIPPQSKNRPLIKHLAAQHLRGLRSLCGILLRHERSSAKSCVPQCNRTLPFFHAVTTLNRAFNSSFLSVPSVTLWLICLLPSLCLCGNPSLPFLAFPTRLYWIWPHVHQHPHRRRRKARPGRTRLSPQSLSRN